MAKTNQLSNKTKDKTEAKILKLLESGTRHVDKIAQETKITIGNVSATLSIMEIRGLVKNYGSGIWGV